jgi:endonuclease/exonuclease/phosphatase family metal-dependent hydrolase
MRVMTFNLRFENNRDGSNAWSLRREMVVAIIESYSPSILGTQEGTCSQIDYLQDHLPDYYLHTPRRVFDDTCQYPTLFIRKDEFDVEGGAEFWLSKTPEVHRSKDWDSAFPRLISYARLRTVTTTISVTGLATSRGRLLLPGFNSSQSPLLLWEISTTVPNRRYIRY